MKRTEQLLIVARGYARLKRRSVSRISTIVFRDGKRLDAVARGADILTSTFEQSMQWFSDNWPEGAVWPKDIARPKAREVQS